jgi:DNA invertase Pin-like site-specific DNA recombinase
MDGGEMALVGYSRVSTAEQVAHLQRDALAAAGCERIFSDVASGAAADRPQLNAALDYLREGDVLCVWRLDRLGRSLRHLLEVVSALQERGVGFRSLHESIDTTTPTGRLTFHVFAALAEFERDLVRERTLAGLTAARARGRLGGRKPSLTPKKVQLGRKLYAEGDSTVAEIANLLGVSRATIYRHLPERDDIGAQPTGSNTEETT